MVDSTSGDQSSKREVVHLFDEEGNMTRDFEDALNQLMNKQSIQELSNKIKRQSFNELQQFQDNMRAIITNLMEPTIARSVKNQTTLYTLEQDQKLQKRKLDELEFIVLKQQKNSSFYDEIKKKLMDMEQQKNCSDKKFRSELEQFRSRMDQVQQRMEVVEQDAQIYSKGISNLKLEINEFYKTVDKIKEQIYQDLQDKHLHFQQEYNSLLLKMDQLNVPINQKKAILMEQKEFLKQTNTQIQEQQKQIKIQMEKIEYFKEQKLDISIYQDLNQTFQNFKRGVEMRLSEMRKEIIDTDIYLEKYLPVKILNFINDSLTFVLDKSEILRLFDYLRSAYKHFETNIQNDDGKSRLNKKEFKIPNLENSTKEILQRKSKINDKLMEIVSKLKSQSTFKEPKKSNLTELYPKAHKQGKSFLLRPTHLSPEFKSNSSPSRWKLQRKTKILLVKEQKSKKKLFKKYSFSQQKESNQFSVREDIKDADTIRISNDIQTPQIEKQSFKDEESEVLVPLALPLKEPSGKFKQEEEYYSSPIFGIKVQQNLQFIQESSAPKENISISSIQSQQQNLQIQVQKHFISCQQALDLENSIKQQNIDQISTQKHASSIRGNNSPKFTPSSINQYQQSEQKFVKLSSTNNNNEDSSQLIENLEVPLIKKDSLLFDKSINYQKQETDSLKYKVKKRRAHSFDILICLSPVTYNRKKQYYSLKETSVQSDESNSDFESDSLYLDSLDGLRVLKLKIKQLQNTINGLKLAINQYQIEPKNQYIELKQDVEYLKLLVQQSQIHVKEQLNQEKQVFDQNYMKDCTVIKNELNQKFGEITNTLSEDIAHIRIRLKKESTDTYLQFKRISEQIKQILEQKGQETSYHSSMDQKSELVEPVRPFINQSQSQQVIYSQQRQNSQSQYDNYYQKSEINYLEEQTQKLQAQKKQRIDNKTRAILKEDSVQINRELQLPVVQQNIHISQRFKSPLIEGQSDNVYQNYSKVSNRYHNENKYNTRPNTSHNTLNKSIQSSHRQFSQYVPNDLPSIYPPLNVIPGYFKQKKDLIDSIKINKKVGTTTAPTSPKNNQLK